MPGLTSEEADRWSCLMHGGHGPRRFAARKRAKARSPGSTNGRWDPPVPLMSPSSGRRSRAGLGTAWLGGELTPSGCRWLHRARLMPPVYRTLRRQRRWPWCRQNHAQAESEARGRGTLDRWTVRPALGTCRVNRRAKYASLGQTRHWPRRNRSGRSECDSGSTARSGFRARQRPAPGLGVQGRGG